MHSPRVKHIFHCILGAQEFFQQCVTAEFSKAFYDNIFSPLSTRPSFSETFS